ncbi:MAG: tRNA (guanosine(46)-N7)-methyltransferase TrmB, partial [Janthinobacterium sp.]
MTESQETPISTEGEERQHRRIKSFVMRAGRMTEGQQRGLEQGGPLFILPLADSPVDYDQVFGRSAPRTLEIGFGMGATTAHIAKAMPEKDFIGVEVHTPGVGSLLKLIGEESLTNLRLLQHDAVEVLTHMIPANSLAGIHVFFPDPWHKARHNKRRLIQSPFVKQLTDRLAPGGYLHCATDWEDYAVQMLDVLGTEPQLRN